MPTYPLPTLAPTVTLTGISAPSYNDVYQSLVAWFQSIYGSDIVIDSSSQDGQWLGVLAQVIYDCGQGAVAVFQAFSPTFAQGAGLSSLVKLTGITRGTPTHSAVATRVGGHANATISNGVVVDEAGNLWNLPTSVTIGSGGTTDTTATAQEAGALALGSGITLTINNPQLGWQTAVTTAAAVAGLAVETDAELRSRQYASTAIPALGIREAIFSTVSNLAGVFSCTVYDNDTGSTDGNGVPAHSIAVVVGGGTTQNIIDAIGETKPPGAQTYGTTSGTYTDQYGLTTPVNFFQLGLVPIYFAITVQMLTGFDTVNTPTKIQNALAAWLNLLTAGKAVYYSQALSVAGLPDAFGNPDPTYDITVFYMGTSASPTTSATIPMVFNQQAQGVAANVAITLI